MKFQAFMNSKKNSCRGNYMRKYGNYFERFAYNCSIIIFLCTLVLQDMLENKTKKSAHDQVQEGNEGNRKRKEGRVCNK